MPDLSVIIPGRNEEFHARTIADVLAHTSDRTEIIAVLDGQWANPAIPQHPRVTVVYLPTSIGQRAATNLGVRMSEARWIAKLDAHCSVAPGWDDSLMSTSVELGRDVTIIPQMYNLHAFSWKCESCGELTYQGPKPETCLRCKALGPFEKEIVWQKRGSRLTQYWRLDSRLEFNYWGAYKSRPDATHDIVDVMTSIGACFFMERERFVELGGLDESHGSWGFFGAEVALKSQLSGGRHVVSKRTWFAHMFRTQGGFSFPYPISGNEQQRAKEYGRKVWLNNAWPGQTRTLRSLVDQYWPIPGWTEEQRAALPVALHHGRRGSDAGVLAGAQDGSLVSHEAPATIPMRRVDPATRSGAHRVDRARPDIGVVYYSHGKGDQAILEACRETLVRSATDVSLVSVTLQPLSFGRNIVLNEQPGILTMFRQILAGLEALDTDVAFLAEHDCLYSPEHFQFRPTTTDRYYYNLNVWHVDAKSGRAITYTAKRTSQLCANRELLIGHYRKRIAIVEKVGFSRKIGFEPGSHRRAERIDDVPSDVWRSAVPNIDIRNHGANLTPSRWAPSEFRDQRNCQDWRESDGVPGWGTTLGRFDQFLQEVGHVQQAVA